MSGFDRRTGLGGSGYLAFLSGRLLLRLLCGAASGILLSVYVLLNFGLSRHGFEYVFIGLALPGVLASSFSRWSGVNSKRG